MITTEKTAELVKQFGNSEKDSGSASVQVAILTTRINNLSSHFEANKLDHHSRHGLLKMIGQRRSLLKYIAKKDTDKYTKLIKDLGLRK